jgi:hypothetical protein
LAAVIKSIRIERALKTWAAKTLYNIGTGAFANLDRRQFGFIDHLTMVAVSLAAPC